MKPAAKLLVEGDYDLIIEGIKKLQELGLKVDNVGEE